MGFLQNWKGSRSSWYSFNLEMFCSKIVFVMPRQLLFNIHVTWDYNWITGGTEGKTAEWKGSCHLQRATGKNWQKYLKWRYSLPRSSGEEDKQKAGSRQRSKRQIDLQALTLDSESNISNILGHNPKKKSTVTAVVAATFVESGSKWNRQQKQVRILENWKSKTNRT